MAKGLYQKWLEPENLTLLQGWRRDGLEIQQIAEIIGVRRQTLYDWCMKYKEIGDALKKGDEICLYEVENKLYKRAVGYDVTEVDQTETTTPDGLVTITKHVRKRHIPPDLGSICFILKNRRPEKWRDRPIVEDNRAIEMLANILAETKKAAEDDSTEVQPETEGVHPEVE